MKILILSHFNPLYGPNVVLKAPEAIEDVDLEQIPATHIFAFIHS